MNLPFYTVSAPFWADGAELCTALWINPPIVLGFIQCYPQQKRLAAYGFLALIPVIHRSTAPAAERIYSYYPMEVVKMRFICDTNELNTALSIVSRALAVRERTLLL